MLQWYSDVQESHMCLCVNGAQFMVQYMHQFYPLLIMKGPSLIVLHVITTPTHLSVHVAFLINIFQLLICGRGICESPLPPQYYPLSFSFKLITTIVADFESYRQHVCARVCT